MDEYVRRLNLAVAKGLEFTPPFHLMRVGHNDWCPCRSGFDCNCDPTIKIISPNGDIEIDKDGNFRRINEH